MMNRVSAEQIRYMEADQTVKKLRKRIEREAPKAPERGSSEESFDQWAEAHEDYLDSIGYYVALDALTTAENAMMTWAMDRMRNHPVLGSRFSEIAIVFEKAPRSPKHRAHLLDLCVKLAA